MAKVWNYVFLTIGLAFLFTISGMQIGADQVWERLGIGFNNETNEIETQQMSSPTESALWLFLFGSVGGILSLIAAGAGTFVASRFTNVTPENYIMIPFITGMGVIFLSIFISIMNKALDSSPWVTYVVLAIFIPLTAGFIVALLEWFRGSD